MSSYCHNLFSFQVCCLLALKLAAPVTCEVFYGEDVSLEKINQLLFSTEIDDQEIEPSVTLKLLKDLRAIYLEKEFESHNRKLSDIGSLVDASNAAEYKCNRQTFRQLNELFSKYYRFLNSIGPYLRHCRNWQLNLCVQNLDRDVNETVTRFPEQLKQNMTSMVEFLTGKNKYIFKRKTTVFSLYEIPRLTYTHGFLLFMEHQYGFIDELLKEKEKGYGRKFRATIGDLCNTVLDGLESSLFIFRTSKPDRINQSTKDWISCAAICHDILGNIDSLINVSYYALMRKNSKRFGWREFSRFILGAPAREGWI